MGCADPCEGKQVAKVGMYRSSADSRVSVWCAKRSEKQNGHRHNHPHEWIPICNYIELRCVL